MTHEEIMQAVEKNKFVRFCGIKLEEDKDGCYYASVDLKSHHHNPYGIAHGGLLYTMADATAGCNARIFVDSPVTLNSDFHFIKNVSKGKLIAKAGVIHGGKHILLIRVRIKSEKDELLAEGTFTYYSR